MTQGELAEKLGVARTTVTQWERGWSSPRMGMIKKLAGVFKVTTSEIVAENDGDDAEPSDAMFEHLKLNYTGMTNVQKLLLVKISDLIAESK